MESIPLEAYVVDGRRANGEHSNHGNALATNEWQPPAVATYGASFDGAKIPQRRWLVGFRRSIGEVTLDVGPPGVNKSMLMICDSVQIVTGRSLLGDKIHSSGEVLFLVGEDARRDFEARLAGILAYYHIPASALGDRLHVVYLAESDATSYTLAQMVDDIAVLNSRMIGWLREYPGVIAVFVDPLAAWHALIENRNEPLQLLCAALRAIAVQGDRHVGVDHHVTKVAMSDPEAHVGNLAAIRGAGSIAGYTRWAFTMARLNPTTLQAFGIPAEVAKRYRRLDPLKTSYSEDDSQVRLLRVESVPIANGETVGVLVQVDMERAAQEAQERKASTARESRSLLIQALTRMLAEKRPRSQNSAALWLIANAPELVRGRNGEPLSEFTVRRRLASMIGAGLATHHDGMPARIVLREPSGNGRPAEIDLAQVGVSG